jgi:hypothetical protein
MAQFEVDRQTINDLQILKLSLVCEHRCWEESK